MGFVCGISGACGSCISGGGGITARAPTVSQLDLSFVWTLRVASIAYITSYHVYSRGSPRSSGILIRICSKRCLLAAVSGCEREREALRV